MKQDVYRETQERIEALIEGETDPIAVMATVACELYHAFEDFHWVGFYRRVGERTLKVGPYQGGHGCLVIDLDRGVCGACARTGATQVENDVSKAPAHIACSPDTRAEIVVPVKDPRGRVTAVLDIDSTRLGAFDEVDVAWLEALCGRIAKRCARN